MRIDLKDLPVQIQIRSAEAPPKFAALTAALVHDTSRGQVNAIAVRLFDEAAFSNARKFG